MIQATVAALQRHGVARMSFTEILDASGAARGAIYHHFPGGKTQLVAEAAARNAQDIRAQLAALPAATPRTVAQAFLTLVRPVMQQSARGGGCASPRSPSAPRPPPPMTNSVRSPTPPSPPGPTS